MTSFVVDPRGNALDSFRQPMDRGGDGRMTGMVDGYNILLADCPARSALDAISGTWAVAVVYALRSGPVSYSNLSRVIGGISNKALASTLKGLESSGLVARAAAPKTGWELTRLGDSLLDPISSLALWAHEHASEIAEAQDEFAG
jgi:DNA-binding HxlR family transcriptional regulator